MGLLNKIKNALFDEEEVEDINVVQKIEKTTIVNNEQPTINHYEEDKEESTPVAELKEESPIIFDVEDFIEEEKEEVYEKQDNEVPQKILYGGYEVKEYEKISEKDKFIPSPVISPVYGIIDKDYKKEKNQNKGPERKSLDRLFVEEKKKPVDFDTIRQKAFGHELPKEEHEEEQGLLYEMQEMDEKPGIDKISLGDAEEYFEDLGLEYDVDYTDLAKQKMTRAKKNKELTEVVDEEIKETTIIENETKKESKIEKEDTAEEKNLYDLIDMMYEEK